MFDAIKKVMEAAGQTTDQLNEPQDENYSEELGDASWELSDTLAEIREALDVGDEESLGENLALLMARLNEVIWLTACVGYSFGLPLKEGMEQYVQANLNKIVDGKIDVSPKTGRLLKPEGWQPPDYSPLIERVLPKLATVH